MSFLNAGLTGFLALGLIPIIIYLINRQRYQRVRWAAMEFLLRAMKKNRRRLRIENLLLLILRTLIILLFVLGMLRPFLDTNPLIGITSSSRAELIIIDRSYSMGFKEGQNTLLFEAVEDAKQRLNDLKKGDRIGLMLAGGTPVHLLADSSYVTADTGASEEILGLLESIELAYEPLEVAFSLEDAASWIREKGAEGGWTIRFYTDLQHRDWVIEEGADATIGKALIRLQQMKVPVVLHPVGREKPRNASILSLGCRDRILAVDLSTKFQVTVAYRSTETLSNLEVELWVDDNVQGSRSLNLDPGGQRVVQFPYVFRNPGLVRLKAVLLADSLEEDNFCYSVLPVREAVEVLIVDGGYQDGADDAAWLDAAIGMGTTTESGIRLTPYDTRVIPPDRFATMDLEETDVVVLANVERFAPGGAGRLEEFLRAGRGLLVFMGRRCNIAHYTNDHYREGNGWFPFAPHDTIVDPSRQVYHGWKIAREGHPVLEYLAREETAGMKRVKIHGYMRPMPGVPASSVLITLDNAAMTPMLIERSFESGTVLVMNISPDREWSNFPISPAYVVFLHESLPYLAASADVIRNLGIGEAFSRVVSSEDFAARVLLISPQGDGVPLGLDPSGADSFRLSVPGQWRPGNYEIRFGGDAGGKEARQDWFSVNADPAEGILARIIPEDLKDAYPEPGEFLVIEESRKADRSQAALPPQRSGEVWRNLFWAVLVFLFMESLLARYFGRRRVRMA